MSHYFRDPITAHRIVRIVAGILCLYFGAVACADEPPVTLTRNTQYGGGIRRDPNDRGTYRPPSLDDEPVSYLQLKPLGKPNSLRDRTTPSPKAIAGNDPVVDSARNSAQPDDSTNAEGTDPRADRDSGVAQVSHTAAVSLPPGSVERFEEPSYPNGMSAEPIISTTMFGEPACGCEGLGCDACDSGFFGAGCDGGYCDDYCNADYCDDGCDGIFGGIFGGRGERPFGRIRLDRDNWFGSLELLLLFRDGDRLPPLVTTGTGPSTTAGQIGQTGTRVLFGGERYLDELAVGGRVTIGTWLDDNECRSLVGRAWYGGRTDAGFGAGFEDFDILARPFNDFSNSATGVPNTQLINFPEQNRGSISVSLESETYGGDLSIRRFLAGGMGASVDVLYGYQYMRLSEQLAISSSTTSLDATPEVGSILAVSDTFDTSNDFHGGQVGLAGQMRDRCWTFNFLAKVGFGSLRRQTDLRGATTITNGPASVTDNQGLLVRETNSGERTDHTFGWVPEIDLGLSYRRFPNYDLSVGYTIIAMTDAVRIGDAIDPSLGSNLSDIPGGAARPTLRFRDETFFNQGIRFGITKVY